MNDEAEVVWVLLIVIVLGMMIVSAVFTAAIVTNKYKVIFNILRFDILL